MARAHYVKAARKDNPVAKAGESYYWWKFRHGGKHYSKTRPRASQLTASDKLSRAYGLFERLEDLIAASPAEELVERIDAATATLEELAADAREIAEEYRESAEAIRESFSESTTADDCEEKADALESWADELDEAVNSLSGIDADDESAEDDLEQSLDGIDGWPL
jgi:chromosome segregation ATPase